MYDYNDGVHLFFMRKYLWNIAQLARKLFSKEEHAV